MGNPKADPQTRLHAQRQRSDRATQISAVQHIRSCQVFGQAFMHNMAGRHQIASIGMSQRLLDQLLDQQHCYAPAGERAGYVQDPVDHKRGKAA
jgi:hypothetical protein